MKPQEIFVLAKKVGKLKRVKRAGWVREQITHSESVAEHTYRLIFLAMLCAPFLGVNTEKLMKMALIHDLGEVAIGDVIVDRGTQIDSSKREEKEKQERRVIQNLFQHASPEYVLLFEELLERKTTESHILWQLDKLEMALSAHDYEEEQQKILKEFFVNADTYLTDSLLRQIFACIPQKKAS